MAAFALLFSIRLWLLAADLSVPENMTAGEFLKAPWDLALHEEDVIVASVATPDIGGDEVLIQVLGSSLNPYEWKELSDGMRFRFPHVSGHDVAGVVAKGGSRGDRLRVGDRVWGFSEDEGAHAEYVSVNSEAVSRAPRSLSDADAGVMPFVGLTALRAFQAASAVGRVLVLDGSSGAGHIGVQLAKALDATSVAVACDAAQTEFCEQTGAEVIGSLDDLEPQSLDIVYDVRGEAGTGEKAYRVLADGGLFVTLTPQALASVFVRGTRPSVTQLALTLANVTYHDLDLLSDLVEKGNIHPHIQSTYSLHEISSAVSESIKGDVVGQIAIQPVVSTSTVSVVVVVVVVAGATTVALAAGFFMAIVVRRVCQGKKPIKKSSEDSMSVSLQPF